MFHVQNVKSEAVLFKNKASVAAAVLYVYWLFMSSAIMIWHKRLFNL